MRAASRWRGVAVALAAVILILAGWRVFGQMRADAAFARGEVAAALKWRPDHPPALLAQAESLMTAGQSEAAAETARLLLRSQPMEGRGYRVLGQVAAAQGDKDRARELHRIAVNRTPRDVPARAWLAQDALEQGNAGEALAQIDQVLTLSPRAGANVFPILIRLSADPAFAEALADVMRRPPAWREGMLAALQRAKGEERGPADQVLEALQRKGGFDEAEIAAWIEAQLRDGHWAQAFARWATPFVEGGRPLPLLFNGDFALEPSGTGFDWRLPVTAGVIVSFEPDGDSGRTLHARFLGRRVAGAILDHRLWLAPGTYRLAYRVRSEALRSDSGLAWTVSCVGKPMALAMSEPMTGSRGWRRAEFEFTVPADGCAGQWLRLANAAGLRAGQIVGGDLWLATTTLSGTAPNSGK